MNNEQRTTSSWAEFVETRPSVPTTVRTRLRTLALLFGLALGVIFLRAVQLEVTGGEDFRRWAQRPREVELPLAASRGRILARDGSVLAEDRRVHGLAVDYRYLQDPPAADWLRSQARSRLPRPLRRDPEAVAAVEDDLRRELADLQTRLAELSQVSLSEWQARTGRIQDRVERLAESVNRQRLARYDGQTQGASPPLDNGWLSIVLGLFEPPDPLPPAKIVVAEQRAMHLVVAEISEEVVAEIRANPERYPGVAIVEHIVRGYPAGNLAAHLVGHVAPRPTVLEKRAGRTQPTSEVAVSGLMGIERQQESLLAGQAGIERQLHDQSGKLIQTTCERPPAPGSDVTLSIDPVLQRAAESWLDRALRRPVEAESDKQPAQSRPPTGGAVVVLDVTTGDILVSASAPRFTPAWFASGDLRAATLLGDPRQPLFDRALKMAIAPGSVLKPLVALALVAERLVDPVDAYRCQGYWEEPDRLRCQIYRQHGIGHGDVSLAGALEQSCNTYFFQHALDLGGPRLVSWALRFGLGGDSALELAGTSGRLPAADSLRQNNQVQQLAIGQGPITATPLAIARLYSAIANGGRLITPRLIETPGPDAPSEATRIAGLDDRSLAAVREGLRRVVNDPGGTAYETVRLPAIEIAGKTGTAETAAGTDHAWFAGYAPTSQPRYAVVVALEHGGSGAHTAGPIARNLIERMQQLGYFESSPPQGRAKSIARGRETMLD